MDVLSHGVVVTTFQADGSWWRSGTSKMSLYRERVSFCTTVRHLENLHPDNAKA